jgi:hypothetical protein
MSENTASGILEFKKVSVTKYNVLGLFDSKKNKSDDILEIMLHALNRAKEINENELLVPVGPVSLPIPRCGGRFPHGE